MKKEDIYLHTYQDFREARRAILEYIEGWYNRKRIHSAIGYMIPQQKEEEEMNYPAASCGVSKVATSTYNPICYTALFSLRFYRLFYNFFPVPVLSHIYL